MGWSTNIFCIKQLLKNDFTYLGMLGSKEKVRQLFEEMIAEGVEKDQLEKVYSPIGLSISSKTPKEIAISILAEIIQVKNSKWACPEDRDRHGFAYVLKLGAWVFYT